MRPLWKPIAKECALINNCCYELHFCHEGPWDLVTQRMWLLDFCSREVRPCFRQGERDTVGHEFWTRDGLIFFDDRGPGHDGTITSERKQAVTEEVPIRSGGDFVPFVGLIVWRILRLCKKMTFFTSFLEEFHFARHPQLILVRCV